MATVAVTVGVLSGTPLLTNLPKVGRLLEAETTSTSVSYSFQCTYVTAGSLIVRLTSASETKDIPTISRFRWRSLRRLRA